MNYKDMLEKLEESIADIKPYVYGKPVDSAHVKNMLEDADPFHLYCHEHIGCSLCPLRDEATYFCCSEVLHLLDELGNTSLLTDLRPAINAYMTKLYTVRRDLIVKVSNERAY